MFSHIFTLAQPSRLCNCYDNKISTISFLEFLFPFKKNIKPNTIYPALYLSCIHTYIYLYVQFFLFIPLVNLGQQMTGLFASHRGPLLCLEVSSSIELKLLTIPLYPHTCGYPTQCVQSHLERADRPRLFRRRHPGIYRVEITGCGLTP